MGAVLADPGRFVGATLADPLEGTDYGICKAKIMQRPDGTVWINSFAHGRTTYELKHDGTSVEVALNQVNPAEAADCFVRLLLASDLEPEEEQRLRALVCRLSGTSARPLDAKIKAARKEHDQRQAQARRERHAAESQDRRMRLEAPDRDAERLPVLMAIDEVLSALTGPEPPMRAAEGRPVEARCRMPIFLHAMTESNGEGEQ